MDGFAQAQKGKMMSDLISRQAMIDAMAELQGRASTKAEFKGISKAWKRIKKLPSAQPEIIRCKDCKRYGQENCFIKIQMLWELRPDDFCSMAERRTDG